MPPRRLYLVAACAGLAALDHRRGVGQQALRVVHDAVLDRLLHAPDAFGAAGLVVEPDRAGSD